MKNLHTELEQVNFQIKALGRPDALACAIARKPHVLKQWDQENPNQTELYFSLIEKRERILEELHKSRTASVNGPNSLSSAGVPPKALEVAENAMATQAEAKVRKFMVGGDSFLVLAGNPGCGKTVAAAVAAKEATKEGLRVVFVRALDANRIGLFGEDLKTINSWASAGLLIVDDLGTEVPNAVWLQNLGDLVDRRYERQAKTILTTNLKIDQLKQLYGVRVMDRLKELGAYFWAGNDSLRVKAEE